MTEGTRLWLFVALVLGLPALLNQAVPAKRPFNAKPIAQLRAKQPDLILIGDSMLDSRIDVPLLEKQLGEGRRVEALWNGGAASAGWYLMLKNYVIASEVRPRLVCIFFRDRLLTDPSFRTEGIFRGFLESTMRDDEPIARFVLGDDFGTGASAMERMVTRVYRLNARRRIEQEKINRAMFQVVTSSRESARALKRQVKETFDVVRLRGEVLAESTEVGSADAGPFDLSPNHSFLPHIVDDAKRAGLPLCFVRVKRHPGVDSRVWQSAALRNYIVELGAWLRTQGCVFIDETDDPAFSPDMYLKGDDDHIGPWAKARSTEIYARKLRGLLP